MKFISCAELVFKKSKNQKLSIGFYIKMNKQRDKNARKTI